MTTPIMTQIYQDRVAHHGCGAGGAGSGVGVGVGSGVGVGVGSGVGVGVGCSGVGGTSVTVNDPVSPLTSTL